MARGSARPALRARHGGRPPAALAPPPREGGRPPPPPVGLGEQGKGRSSARHRRIRPPGAMTLLVTVAGRERTRGRALLASPGRAPLYLASSCSTPPAVPYAAVVDHLETPPLVPLPPGSAPPRAHGRPKGAWQRRGDRAAWRGGAIAEALNEAASSTCERAHQSFPPWRGQGSRRAASAPSPCLMARAPPAVEDIGRRGERVVEFKPAAACPRLAAISPCPASRSWGRGVAGRKGPAAASPHLATTFSRAWAGETASVGGRGPASSCGNLEGPPRPARARGGRGPPRGPCSRGQGNGWVGG
jgi:hypothetical protein